MSDKGDIAVPPADLLATLMQRPDLADEVANRILEDPTAESWLPAVPSPLIHRLISEVGMGDAGELMELCAPEQVRDLLDMEIWQGDRIKPEEALDWIQFLSTLSDRAATRHIHGLDVELLGWLLLKWCHIHLIDDGNFPEEPAGEVWTSPDNWFAVEVLARNKAQTDQVTTLLNHMYEEDPDDTRRLLQNLIWELPTELEEWSYRWRTGRLADLGFADPQASLLIYTYLSPGAITLDEGTADRPVQAVEASAERTGGALTALVDDARRSFWSRATDAINDPQERERISLALMTVANWALAADRISPADREAAGRSLEDLHLRLSLGLEHLCGGDLGLASVALANVALMRLARVGHSLALDLRRDLLALQREGKLGAAPGSAARLDPPLRAQVEGLLRLRPRFLETKTGAHRAFQAMEELVLARTWIDQAHALVSLMDQLGLPQPYPVHTTLGSIFRTRVINAVMGHQDGPLDVERLAGFMAAHLVNGELDAATEDEAVKLANSVGGSPVLVEVLMAPLAEELGPISPDDLDLRFIQSIWSEAPGGL